jgi:hypothetical protein
MYGLKLSDFQHELEAQRDRAVILHDEYAHLATPLKMGNGVFRLGVKEVLTCDPGGRLIGP